MSAVVRVKRRIDEEPLNAFVLNCKRRKVDEVKENLLATKNEVSTILKFAGTVNSQEENISAQITKLTKDEAKQLALKTRKPNNLLEQRRQEMRNSLHDNRFKVVNCYREIKEEDDPAAIKEITILDIEKQTDADSQQTSSTSATASGSRAGAGDSFVYDLYVPDSDQTTEIDGNLVDNLLSIRPFDDLVYEDRNADANDSDDYDSEDSNEENNWRNEYPDTEDDSSVNENDIRHAVEDIDIDGDRDLSSDDEDHYRNGFVYSVDSEAIGFEDDIDYCDVNRYGEAYARYKARILKKSKSDSDDYDSDVNDYDSD